MRFFTKLLLLLLLFIHVSLFASDLVLIHPASIDNHRQLFKHPSLVIHHYDDEIVVATSVAGLKEGMVLLDRDPWASGYSYYLVYLDDHADKQAYLEHISPFAVVLYDSPLLLVVRSDERQYGQLPPAADGSMVRIFEHEARLPRAHRLATPARRDADPFVHYLINQVDGQMLTDRVQHLENYGTRDAYVLESILAQLWIEEQFLNWGLEVETMEFYMPGGPSSDNVIARITGTKYPDEYIVLGGHYDSISWSGLAPGADDNASGTSGVMAAARILSNYEFDRSIVFIAFSGEEYGLYGSAAYASQAAQQGKNILGYINMDMIGYLKPGHTTIMTSLIYPQSAAPLADFYADVTALYLPDFVVQHASLPSGYNSDHTSFNNNGFMGIFPFEDANNFSPYIHTANDIVGLSYNHEEQAVMFTKAAIATVVTLANMLTPPGNLVAIPGDGQVELTWNEMVDVDYYKVYRDNEFIAAPDNNHYLDTNVENEIQYEYYVTAVYSDSGEESDPSDTVTVTPMPPISFPLFIDFENGTPYWYLDEPWGLTTQHAFSPSHSLTESPYANYANNRHDHAVLQPISLAGYTDATLSFRTRYNIENNWDFMYLELSVDGSSWITIDTFTGIQSSWVHKIYPLTDYAGEPFVSIRFRFFSDHIITREGMYIDDFMITVEGDPTYNVYFNVTNEHGDAVEQAVTTFDGVQHEPGAYVFEDVAPGNYEYQITKTCYDTYEGTLSIVSNDVYAEVVLPGMPGDANGDGVVNVLDVISIVNYFSGEAVASFCPANADVNQDGIVNVLDVIATVDLFSH
ncbi:MAG: M28 family peptidase [Bacteroidales bacterium]|nr:M28 family peptidase [Bacteroidales bacterium]